MNINGDKLNNDDEDNEINEYIRRNNVKEDSRDENTVVNDRPWRENPVTGF